MHIGTFKSLVHDIFPIVMRGDEVKIFEEIAHADIYLCRAQIVSHFLDDPEATDLVMIDNDVAWESGSLMKLLDHDCDLVAGAYPKREEPIQFMFRSALDEGKGLMGDPETGLVEVWGMPGGFMRMTRTMLEKMVAWYGEDLTIADHMVPSKRTVRLFDPYYFKGPDGLQRALSEDYAFCQRWRDIGGKVFMDATIPMAHVGLKVYAGVLGKWLHENLEPTGEKKEKAA